MESFSVDKQNLFIRDKQYVLSNVKMEKVPLGTFLVGFNCELVQYILSKRFLKRIWLQSIRVFKPKPTCNILSEPMSRGGRTGCLGLISIIDVR